MGKKNVDTLKIEFIFKYFESFYKMKLCYRPGAFAPRTHCGRRVIAFKWPGRPPRKNPGTPLETSNFLKILMEILKFSEFNFSQKFRQKFRIVHVYRVLAIFISDNSKINGIFPFYRNFSKFPIVLQRSGL